MGDAAGKARGELGLPEQAGGRRPAPPPAEEPVYKPASARKQKRLSTWLDQRQKLEQHHSATLSTTWEVVLGSCLFQCSVSSLLSGAQAIGAAVTGSMAGSLGFASPSQGCWLGHTVAHKWPDWWRPKVAQCLSWEALGMSSGWS